MHEQKQDDRLEPMYNGSVPINNIPLKTSREQWTKITDGERGSRRFMVTAWHDNDDDADDDKQLQSNICPMHNERLPLDLMTG